MPKTLHIEIVDAAGTRRVQLEAPNPDEGVTLGSDEAAAVRVMADSVSATHAELFCDGEFWCVRDRASLTGTYLDGNRLFITAIRLENGQRVRLGTGDGAPSILILDGAAAPREGVNVRAEVASFVKAQTRERKRLPVRWAVAVPSAGALVIALLWAAGAGVVAHRRAALRENPNLAEEERAQREQDGGGRLAAIMAGEARPEDVDVNQIIKDASFGRSSKLVNAALGMMRPGTSIASSHVEPQRSTDHRRPRSAAPAAQAVDEGSLAALVARRRSSGGTSAAQLEASITQQSRTITLRRLSGMLDERVRLASAAATLSAPDAARLAEIDRRLASLGIDASKLQWQAGTSDEALAAQIDIAVLEAVRQKLLAALSTR